MRSSSSPGSIRRTTARTAIVHVFGRTTGTEPHTYYYRRFDYRQWTPWEKVDLDIQGDYLIPAVVANRLFLFWPVFMEVPDQKANSTVSTPKARTSPAVPVLHDDQEAPAPDGGQRLPAGQVDAQASVGRIPI